MKTSKGMDVDHIDHDGLNNQKSNLRNCTRSENAQNQRHYASSDYQGTSWHKRSRKFRSQIGVKGNRIHLGFFNSEIDAAKAYDKAALKYYGEYAKTNFNLGGG